MTAPNALMGGWIAVWKPASTKEFAASVVKSSVSFTCGTTDLTVDATNKMTYNKDYLLYEMPVTANTATVTGITGVVTYAASCAAK